MKRIGVFVCHCGTNIAGTVDVERVVREIQKFPDVVYAVDYKYMCSDPGQALIREHIREDRLDAVVVAACSPAMHETTFRRAAESAGAVRAGSLGTGVWAAAPPATLVAAFRVSLPSWRSRLRTPASRV